MYELNEENYDKAILIYDEDIGNKPFGMAIKNKISPFFVVYKGDDRITNFIVYSDDENWFAFDRKIINNKILMDFLLDKLQTKYDYLTIYLNEQDKELISKAEKDYNFKKTNIIRQNHIKMRKDF